VSNELSELVTEYTTLGERIKELQELQKPLKERLSFIVDAEGEQDEKESYWIKFNEPVAGVVALQHQRKVQIGLDMEAAVRILTERGLADTCLITVPAIDDDAVAAARFENKLTDADLDEMFPKKIVWALVPQRAK